LARKDKPYVRAAFDREEKLYLFKAGLLILAIYFFRREVYDLVGYFALFLPLFFFCYIWFKSMHTGDRLIDILKQYVTFMPIPYAEGGKKVFIPRATILLVSLNILVFYFMKLSTLADSNLIFANFSFLPDKITWWNILVSPITCMFIHADSGHLWANMIFFWAFGPAVEERLGTIKFVCLYLFSGVLGSVTAVLVYNIFLGEIYRGIGASGAISGIMGVFMVRCYFKKLVIPLPLFGLLNAKLKINSLLLTGFFFLQDFQGGVDRLSGIDNGVGYWVHVGSLIAGMLISARLKLHRDAAEEKYTESGLQAMENTFSRRESKVSLQKALELNPENQAALLGLAREYTFTRKPEGRELFQRAIRLEIRYSPAQAAEIYKEYLNLYNRMLDPDLQYRLGCIFYRQGEFEHGAHALEMIILEPSASDDTRQRAFYQLVILLAENNMLEAAHFRLEQFGEQFPKSELVKAAEDKFVEILKK
jgi:membrane associated rhomboid family serine protease